MELNDTTLDSTAPADAGQPVATQAVDSVPSATDPAELSAQPVASTEAAQPVATPRLLAGKYKSADELEHGYAESTQEAMRLYRENQELLKQMQGQGQAKPATSSESYTPEQLQTYREHWSREALKAQAAGDAATAADCLGKVNQCNDKLVEARLQTAQDRWRGETAVQQFQSDASKVIKPYQQDLMNPVSPLNQAAQGYFMQAKQAIANGQSVDAVLSLLSSSLAVLKTGKNSSGAEAKARGEFSASINQAMKQAVITGGGSAAAPVSTTPDFDNMSSAKFKEYQRSIGVTI